MHVSCRANQGMHQSGLSIHAHVRFHATGSRKRRGTSAMPMVSRGGMRKAHKMPLIAFPGLMHFSIAFSGFILGAEVD